MPKHLKAIAFCTLLSLWLQPAHAQYPQTGNATNSTGVNPSVSGNTTTTDVLPTGEGERALDLGEYSRAETLFANQLKNAGKNDKDRGYLQTGYAEALLNQGRFSEAAKEYKKAESIIKDQKQPDELTARLYDGLSWLNHGLGKLDAAQDYAQKALSTRQSIANPSKPLLVATLTHLGHILEAKGNLTQANQYYQKALGEQDLLAGPGSLTASDLQENIGSVSRRLGDINKAQQCFRAALQIKLARNASLTPFSPHPYWETVTYPFLDGSPNCNKRFEQGVQQEIITANGVTVAVSLKPVESTKSTQVVVVVQNDSQSEIQFLPIPPSLTVTAPKIYLAPQIDSSKLAAAVEKRGDRKASWVRFWGNQATQTMTTTCIGQPGFFGNMPVYGGYGYGGGYGGYNSWGNRSGNMSFMTTSVPDYAAQQRALQRAEEISSKARQNADSIKVAALGPTSIAAGQTISGALYFDADKISEAAVRIPIGNAIYEFSFPPK